MYIPYHAGRKHKNQKNGPFQAVPTKSPPPRNLDQATSVERALPPPALQYLPLLLPYLAMLDQREGLWYDAANRRATNETQMDLWWLNLFFAHIHHLPLQKVEGASKMKQPTPSMAAACSEQLASGKHSTAAAFETTIWPWWKGKVNLRWLKPRLERKPMENLCGSELIFGARWPG